MQARTPYFILGILLVLSLVANAQPPVLWTATEVWSTETYGWSIMEVPDPSTPLTPPPPIPSPGYILGGYAQAPGADMDGHLWKVDLTGATVFQRSYTHYPGSNYDEVIHSVAGDTLFGTICGGYIQPYPPVVGQKDMWLLRTDQFGNPGASTLYGNPAGGDDECWSICRATPNEFLLGGYTTNATTGQDFLLWATGGCLNFSFSWNRAGNDVIYSVLEIAPNDFIVAGVTQVTGTNDGYLANVVVGVAGPFVNWQRIYYNPSLPGDEIIFSVDQVPGGGYILAGITNFQPPNDWDGLQILTDAVGIPIWTKIYGGVNEEILHCVQYSSYTLGGGYLAAGRMIMNLGGPDRSLALRTVPNGSINWFQSFPFPPGANWEHLETVAVTTDRGAIFGGKVGMATLPQLRMLMIKMAPVILAEDPGSETGGEFCSEDFLSPNTPELEISSPQETASMQIGPNPFNPATAISYQLPAAGHVSLLVYDTIGRLVTTLVEGWREAGAHELNFDAARFPSGVYFCRLQAGDYSAVQKLVLMK